MKNEEYKLDTTERITRLETKVDEILGNHLPHIQDKIDRIQWLLVTSLVGVIISLVVLLVKK